MQGIYSNDGREKSAVKKLIEDKVRVFCREDPDKEQFARELLYFFLPIYDRQIHGESK